MKIGVRHQCYYLPIHTRISDDTDARLEKFGAAVTAIFPVIPTATQDTGQVHACSRESPKPAVIKSLFVRKLSKLDVKN